MSSAFALIIVALAAAPLARLDAQPSASELVVDVTGGKVRGAPLAAGAAAFLGIPYARPPVGPLRWREPAPVEPWAGIRDATAYGAPCAQNGHFNPAMKERSREDCLYLNVWTPGMKSPG